MNYRIQYMTDDYRAYRTAFNIINEIDRLSEGNHGFLSSGGEYTHFEQKVIEDEVSTVRAIMEQMDKDIHELIDILKANADKLSVKDRDWFEYVRRCYTPPDIDMNCPEAKCPDCNGKGSTTKKQTIVEGKGDDLHRVNIVKVSECPKCGGKGVVP